MTNMGLFVLNDFINSSWDDSLKPSFWCYLQVYSILRHVAEVLEYTKDEQLESLYQRTAWVFDEKYKRPGYGAYDVFKQAVS